jgi:hypothetical protein
LIINKDQYERTSGHYIRIKEYEYRRLVIKIDLDEEREKFFSQKFNYEDSYEKIDEMDYYRKWF